MTIDYNHKFIPRDAVVHGRLDQGTARLRIFHRILNSPLGATCDELEIRLGLTHQTASGAITALLKKGLIVDSGETRQTRSRRKARVYMRRKRK